MHRRTLIAVCLLATVVTTSSGAQTIIIGSGKPTPGRPFSGFGSAPISSTTVLHDRMDEADSGGKLGFALVIRGASGWYNAHVTIGDIPPDSLAPGEVGQRWTVGAVKYQFIYNAQRKTLVVFDTTLTLDTSQIVLVSLGAQPGARPTITLGQPVTLKLSEPTAIAPILVQRVPEIRAFAGLP